MSETTQQYNPEDLSEIYAKLNKQDIEQFYAGYQWWNLQQRFVVLQEQVESLHRQIAENAELMQLFHPPAISLATMARLQASGVNDLDLLDRMLERGEDWLDRTMQRLDYCEQLDFIIDDYTQWCQNALEGAYDWIDSIREGGISDTSLSSDVPTSDTFAETTEELFLLKLTSEEEEQLLSSETTLKQPDLYPSASEEIAATSEEPATIIEELSTPLEASPGVAEPAPSFEEDIAAIAEPPITEEPSPSLEEAISESQQEQVSQVSQLSQVSQEEQPIELRIIPDPLAKESTPQENIEPESQAPQPVEISQASDTASEATSATDIAIQKSDQEGLSPAVAGDSVSESPSEIAGEHFPTVEEIASEEPDSVSPNPIGAKELIDAPQAPLRAPTDGPSLRSAVVDESPAASVPATTEPPPIEASSTSDSEQPVTEEYEILRFAQDDTGEQDDTVEAEMDPVSESEQLTSPGHIEFDPALEELPPVEENDSSNVQQPPLQEDSEGGLAAEEPLLTTDQPPTYESLPYRMYPPDRQPGIQADEIEKEEQSTQVTTTPRRRRNFLQRLAAKFGRR